MRLPKPVLALAVTAVFLIFAVQFPRVQEKAAAPALSEGEEYLEGEFSVGQIADNDGYGTDIEEYFL